MDFELLVVKGRSANQALKLVDGVNTVGRHDDCTIRIKSSQVSRKHCELFEKKGALLVKDLASANGTFVNGKKVQGQQLLEPGDELSIGGVKLRVARVGEVPPVKQTPAVPASDTAVGAAAVSSGSDDEFEIDFDDEPAGVEEALVDDAIEIDVDDELTPTPAYNPTAEVPQPRKESPAEPTRPKAAEPAKPKAPEPQPAAEAELADEAIADFLLDIKLDDDE